MRVLIVENEPAFALTVEDIAIAEGFEITRIARNTAEAMELAPEADIAILDVSLADGLTGPHIAKQLVERFNVGIVYLTGNPDLVARPGGRARRRQTAGCSARFSTDCVRPRRGAATGRGNSMRRMNRDMPG